MKMKKVLAVLAAMSMAISLVGCGGDTKKPQGDADSKEYDWSAGADASNGDVTIRISTWRESDREYYEELIQRFEDKYDWITVELDINQDTNAYYTNLQADIVDGTAPDVFDIHPTDRLITYAEEGIIVPQTDFDYMENYSDKAKEVTNFEGENYGFAAVYNYYGFIYNKKAFEKNGLTVPTTPEELIAAVKKLKDAGFGGVVYPGATWDAASGLSNAVFVNCMGAEGYTNLREGIDNGSIIDVTKVDGVTTALDTLQVYTENNIYYNACEGISYDAGLSLYAQEKSAIMYSGSFVFHDYIEKLEGVDSGFFAVPTYAETGYSYAEAGQISCINAKSESLGAAKLWVEYLATAEVSKYLSTNQKMFSTINGVTPEFDGAQMLMGAGECAMLGIVEPENTEYWLSSWTKVLEGIVYDGKDWKTELKKFSSKLEDYDLKSLK